MGEQVYKWIEAFHCKNCEEPLTQDEIGGNLCPYCGALSEFNADGHTSRWLVPYVRKAVRCKVIGAPYVSLCARLKRWIDGEGVE